MMYLLRIHFLYAVVMLAAIIVTGCVGSSQNAKFYSLSSSTLPESAKTSSSRESIVIAVGPLSVPEYLDRPQIITRSGKNELIFSEFERWGGSLENELQRVITENIGAFLGSGYAVIHWPSSGMENLQALYRISIDILQFEGVSGNVVALKSQWTINRADDKERVMVRLFTIAEPADGQNSDAIVSAMSQAAAKLSTEIAATIRKLPRQIENDLPDPL